LRRRTGRKGRCKKLKGKRRLRKQKRGDERNGTKLSPVKEREEVQVVDGGSAAAVIVVFP